MTGLIPFAVIARFISLNLNNIGEYFFRSTERRLYLLSDGTNEDATENDRLRDEKTRNIRNVRRLNNPGHVRQLETKQTQATYASNKANDVDEAGILDAVNGLEERACATDLDDMVNTTSICLSQNC